MTENVCQTDLAYEKIQIRISDSKSTTVGSHIGDRYEHLSDDEAHVIQTVKITDNLKNYGLFALSENDVGEIMPVAATELQNAEKKGKNGRSR